MISLARQLALRREIEEELGELAGCLGRRDGERLGVGAKWRGRTDAERARDTRAALARYWMRRAPCACGAPRPKHAKLCPSCSRASRLARAKARWRRQHPLIGGCVDCGGARYHRGSPRCRTCRVAYRRRRSMLSAIAKKKAASVAARAALRCCDCHGPIPDARSTQWKSCKPCRARAKALRARERQRRYQQRLRAAQQRRAA